MSARAAVRDGLDAALGGIVIVPALVFLVSSVAADMVAVVGRDPVGIWSLLPAGPVQGPWLWDEISSTGLLLIAIALLRGKRWGFGLALATMAGAVVVQGLLLHHPIAAIAAILVGLVLVATRARYEVGTGPTAARGAVVLVGVAILAAAAGATVLAHAGDLSVALVAGVGGALDLASPAVLPGVATVAAALVVARVAFVLASVMILGPARDERSAEEEAAARELLVREGRGALLPYQLDSTCIPVASPDGRAVIAVARAGRAVVALGGPAGDASAGADLVTAWADRCRRADLIPALYQVDDGWRRRMEMRGWRGCAIGREAIVDPTTFDLGSPRLANVRHTVTRSRRAGLSTKWFEDGAVALRDPTLAEELAELDRAWRRTVGPEMGFTVGRFEGSPTGPFALTLATEASGRPVAFAVLRPTGTDGGWMLDLMRRRNDTAPGAVEACLVAAIEGLRSAGVRRLSLGLAPLDGLDPRSGPGAERALAIAARVVRPVYDTRGLAFFKDKFAPTWESRSVVVPHRWDFVAASIALLRLHLGGSWPRVALSLAAGLRPLADGVRSRAGSAS